MIFKSLLELLPGNSVRVLMSKAVRFPPSLGSSLKLSSSIKHLLSVSALGDVQLLLNGLQPVYGVHGVRQVSEERWTSLHELTTLVPWWRGWMVPSLVLVLVLELIHGHVLLQ